MHIHTFLLEVCSKIYSNQPLGNKFTFQFVSFEMQAHHLLLFAVCEVLSPEGIHALYDVGFAEEEMTNPKICMYAQHVHHFRPIHLILLKTYIGKTLEFPCSGFQKGKEWHKRWYNRYEMTNMRTTKSLRNGLQEKTQPQSLETRPSMSNVAANVLHVIIQMKVLLRSTMVHCFLLWIRDYIQKGNCVGYFYGWTLSKWLIYLSIIKTSWLRDCTFSMWWGSSQ